MTREEIMVKERHIGTMRFDFADGDMCNKWFPYQYLTKEDIAYIQHKVNDIMFNIYDTFDKIIAECGGTGYNYEKIVYQEEHDFLYAIKLIPVMGTYNGYIYIYRK